MERCFLQSPSKSCFWKRLHFFNQGLTCHKIEKVAFHLALVASEIRDLNSPQFFVLWNNISAADWTAEDTDTLTHTEKEFTLLLLLSAPYFHSYTFHILYITRFDVHFVSGGILCLFSCLHHTQFPGNCRAQWWEQQNIIQGWQHCSRNLTSLMKTVRETKQRDEKGAKPGSDGRSNEGLECRGAPQRLTEGFQVIHKWERDQSLSLIYVVIKLLVASPRVVIQQNDLMHIWCSFENGSDKAEPITLLKFLWYQYRVFLWRGEFEVWQRPPGSFYLGKGLSWKIGTFNKMFVKQSHFCFPHYWPVTQFHSWCKHNG